MYSHVGTKCFLGVEDYKDVLCTFYTRNISKKYIAYLKYYVQCLHGKCVHNVQFRNVIQYIIINSFNS